MVDWWGPRAPRWSYMLLNRHDEELGLLDGVSDASVKIVAQSRLGGSAEMVIDDLGQGIDWLSDRVRITYDPGIPGAEPWPVGTFMFSSPVEQYTPFGLRYAVTLTPKTSVIDSATVPAGFSIPAGTPTVEAIVGLIESTGETRIAATESDSVTRSLMVWPEGATKLTVINDLLTSINYWALWCDGSGQFRVEPYVAPGDRPVVFDFASGARSITRPEYEREFDQATVPNVFRVYAEGDEDMPPIVGEAVNEDPASPYSIPSRGFEVGPPPERVEVTTQAEADALAQRRLLDGMSPVSRLTAEHALVPLEPNDLVRFTPSRGASRLVTVQAMSFDCTFDAHVSAEWREVQ